MPVDHAHAPFAQFFLQEVFGQLRSDVGLRLGLELLAEPIVVGLFALGEEQADPGLGELLEQGLGLGGVFVVEVQAQSGHPLISRRLDHVGVLLEALQPEQPIVVGRSFLNRDAEPPVIRVKDVAHGPGD